jgi:hydrogenase nickel incorporation protein HypA/HybF
MHERSVAKALLNHATRICDEQPARKLVEVRVQIGPLSGVDAVLLESAFHQLVCESGHSPVRLIIESTTLLVHCRDCGEESELPEFDFQCGWCHSRSINVVSGDKIQLLSVTVDDDTFAPEQVP